MSDPLNLPDIHAGDILQVTAYHGGALDRLTARRYAVNFPVMTSPDGTADRVEFED
jgi:hypothetical protein